MKKNTWKALVLLLKKIAEDKGISHYKIADETGIHRSNVTRFFTAETKPYLDTFLKIAKAIQVNFFFQDMEDKSDLNRLFNEAMNELGRRPKT